MDDTTTVIETRPSRPAVRRMPPWSVLLHNDDVNDMLYVTDTIMELTTLNREDSIQRTIEAHQSGVALLVTTHREHAELLGEQFTSKQLTVTIEPG